MKKPTFFGKYLLLERINVGGMAEIFIAKSFGVEGFERILAIKKILPTMAEDDEFIRMFIDEARISAQLNHANIVHIHELGRNDDNYFIAMEYVAGRDVRTLIETYRRRRETMPTAQAVFIASKMCEGLDYAHRRKDARGQPLQIIHRDVSPQNILISYEGEVKIIDFGIAKAANRTQKTQAGILKGKFGYMSPEQVRGQPIDRRSDVFAVGVILYEMLTGEKLFVGESDFSTLEKVRSAEVPLPTQFNPSISPGLERVLLKALARDPEARYQWASELQEDLMRFLLAGESIYSSKLLSAFMKDTFAEQLRREAERMERYAGVEGPGGLGELRSGVAASNPGVPESPGDEEASRSLSSVDAPEGEDGADASADKTQIFDPSEIEAPERSVPGPVSVFVDDPGSQDAVRAPLFSLPEAEAAAPKAQVVIGASSVEVTAGETVIGRPPRRPLAASSRQAASEGAVSDSEEPVQGHDGPSSQSSDEDAAPALPHAAQLHRRGRVSSASAQSARERAAQAASASMAWLRARPLVQKRAALAVAALLGVGLATSLFISGGAPESGSILVLVRPAEGARVLANGRPVTPNAIVQLPLGTHRLEASAPGFQPLAREVLVASGETPPVIELTLKPLPASAPPPPAEVVATAPAGATPSAAVAAATRVPRGSEASAAVANPASAAVAPGKPAGPAPSTFAALFVGESGAEVKVEGRSVGRTPEARLANLIVGRRYGFTASRTGYKPFSGEFRSDGASEVKVSFKLERDASAVAEAAKRPDAAAPRPVAVAPRAAVRAAAVRGALACSTRPAGAQVWVDGRNTGRQTPIALGNPLLLPVGKRQVVFKLNGKQSAPTDVTITEDSVAKLINVPLE